MRPARQRHAHKILPVALLAFSILALLPLHAWAKKAPGGFSGKEIKAVLPLLRRGHLVGLSEKDPKGNPKAMTLAIRVKAPAQTVFETIENPENYYYISTLLKENHILQEHENTKAWSWASRHKLFSFTGTNAIALFPPRRADVSFLKSNIGDGKFTFILHPDGEDHTILVLSGILDVESSEWLIRYLVGGNPAMKDAMNVAIGQVITMGIKSAAERAAKGKKPAKHRTRGKAGGEMQALSQKDLIRLAPLLIRGQVILTRSWGKGRLRQTTVVDVFDSPAKKILDAISTPKNYQKMIKAISDVKVHEAAEKEILFSWTLGFSIFGITSKNRMTPVENGVLLEGIEGDLAGAKWRWQLAPTSETKTVVAYHGYAPVAQAAYILKKTVKREPYLEHGLVTGSNMVMMRAIKRSVEH